MRPASSAVLRSLRQRSQLAQRRFASSNTEQAQKRVQETLASAQKQALRAWDTAKKYAGPLSERIGAQFGAVRESVTYNFAVAKEVLKHIYVAERLQPPSVAEIKSAYSTLAQRLSSPAVLRDLFRTGEYVRVMIYGVEAYGIFKIGEIIGRRSLVGYNIQ
ncbi:mitochondrial ATP synthase g subunit-domain-containing protein [Vararia minispora EC-137]|uniref:Mitochondrial ATP synthase g subunit-domain-containing protein n=1 Tax=Vararia minispora EC-137 TaxID=1314806 RepID=A0ACB8QR79_9AGAM|nr:mitochondrial ATP synthase g subunit-domain-containing protein [Vararia minispora EC-137]